MDSSVVGFAAIFGAFFAIANPVSGIPFFLGYTAPLTKWRDKLLGAILVCVTLWVGATIILFAGKAVLDFFGITIPGLRLGGGFVILLSGIAMMNTHVDDVKKAGRSLSKVVHDLVRRGHHPASAAKQVAASSADAAASLTTATQKPATGAVSDAIAQAVAQGDASSAAKAGSKDQADDGTAASADSAAAQPTDGKARSAALLSLMFPFAIPMVLGPGFMSTILIAEGSNSWDLVMLGYTLIIGITFVCLVLASPIRALLGSFGMNILLRLVGLIVIILAFEIMTAGLVKLLPGLGG